MALEPAKLSDFRMAGALGMGATARVYEAVHIASGRPVAIKLMEGTSSSEMRERFAREALLISEVQSRHVSRILGFGFDRGTPFLVLERLNGETLDAKLRRDGPVPPPIAVRWIEQLIVGIRDCHDAKVIHRDIKPSNIFLHWESAPGALETVKLIDFGVARLREIAGDTGLTSPSHLIGSMGYIAPEQFENAKGVGFTADLYAVGVVIFRMFTGRLPFVSRSLEAVIRMKCERPVPAISSMPLMVQSRELDWFVDKATSCHPANRFQSAREMLEQWRSVVASFQERGIVQLEMRGTGRSSTAPPPMMSQYPVSPGDLDPRMREKTEESMPALSSEMTVRDEGEEREEAPRTVPSQELRSEDTESAAVVTTPRVPDPDDVFDVPTRSHPDLRKLVEQELELFEARKGSKERP